MNEQELTTGGTQMGPAGMAQAGAMPLLPRQPLIDKQGRYTGPPTKLPVQTDTSDDGNVFAIKKVNFVISL